MDIFETQKHVWEYESLKNQYWSFFQNEKQRSTKRTIALGTVAFLIGLVMFVSCLWSEDGGAMAICLTLPIALIVFPFVVWYIKKTSHTRDCTAKEILKVQKKHGDEINILKEKIQKLEGILSTSDLPTQYHCCFAVNWMVDAILSKRADTLKEVINLYETYVQKERHHQEELEAIKNIEITYYY